MSLTCSFRDLADQVKHHLVGSKRRASSSHDCHTHWDMSRDREQHLVHGPSGEHVNGADFRTSRHDLPESETSIRQTRCECRTQKPHCSTSLTSITMNMDNACDLGAQSSRKFREMDISPHRKACHVHHITRDMCCVKQSTNATNEAKAQVLRSDSLRTEPKTMYVQRFNPRVISSTTAMPSASSSCNVSEDIRRPMERACNTSTLVLSFNPQQSQCSKVLTHHPNPGHTVTTTTQSFRKSGFTPIPCVAAAQADLNTRSTLSLVPDLSVPQDEVRSSSLGATHTCFHIHQFHQLKPRARKVINPSWNAPEPIQEHDNLRRMTMSYSGLTTVPTSGETEQTMTVSQELSQSQNVRTATRQTVYSNTNGAKTTGSIFPGTIDCVDSERVERNEVAQSHKPQQQLSSIPKNYYDYYHHHHQQQQQQQQQPPQNQQQYSEVAQQSVSSLRPSRRMRPQPACPSSSIMQSTSNEPAPPILPARTTSLFARQSNTRTDLAKSHLCVNRSSRSMVDPGSKSKTRRSISSDQEYVEPNMVNSSSSNNVPSVDHNHSIHMRSRSDMTISKLRCYVNTCDALPNRESTQLNVPNQTDVQQTRLISAESRNQSDRGTGTLEQDSSPNLNDTASGVRSTIATDQSSQTSLESHKTISSKHNGTAVSDALTQTLPSVKHSIGLVQLSDPIGAHNVPTSSSCGILDQAMPMNHASRLLGRMSDKLRDGRLADVILLAGYEPREKCHQSETQDYSNGSSALQHGLSMRSNETRVPAVKIPAHRVILAAASDYFAAMFGNEVKEASETEIWIHNVEPNALQTLINYIYTGYLDLREDTVEDILEAACFLQIVEASQACERYLIKRLHASNCLGMSRLGDQHGCQLLRRKATKYALEHFTEVAQQPDFLNLTFDELTELLQSDHLNVPNEATVFAACLRWVRNSVNRDATETASHSLLTQLLKYVRLQHLPTRLLTEVMDKEPLFHRDMEAIRMLLSALRSHFALEAVTQDSMQLNYAENDSQNSDTLRAESHSAYPQLAVADSPSSNRGSHAAAVRVAHSNEDFTTVPVPRELSLVRQTPRPSTIGRLWALGGKTMVTTRALQEILEYDPYWNSWRTVGQLPGQRQQCGCIVLQDGRLLVVGGRDELKTLSTVECIYTDELMQSGDHTIHRTFKEDRTTAYRGSSNLVRRSRLQRPNLTGVTPESDSTLIRTTSGDASTESDSLKGNSSSSQSNECNTETQSGWNVVSAMATHRHGLGVAVLEGVVYAVGGHDGWSYLNTVERWNGKAKAWSSVTPMAVQRSTVGVTALDGLLYAVGGRDGSACLRTVERFNPHTQHWCFIAPMLHRRGGVGVGAVGGRLYAVGGHNAPPNQPHAMRTASVEVYEPRTDMWTEVACLSSPRDSIAVTTLGMKLYALGGHDGHVYTDRVQVYDPETNQWTDVAPLPSGRAGVAVASRSICPIGNQNHSRFPYYKADPLA